MTKKKRSAPTLESLLERPWCFYCERDFDDLKVLMQHQKAKHFKCNSCNRRLNTAGGLVVHMTQVHKEELNRIENALPMRDNPHSVEIFGMEGIPQDAVLAHNSRIANEYYAEQADHQAKTGNPPRQAGAGGASKDPGNAAKKPKIETQEEIKARLQAKIREMKLAKAAGKPATGSENDAAAANSEEPRNLSHSPLPTGSQRPTNGASQQNNAETQSSSTFPGSSAVPATIFGPPPGLPAKPSFVSPSTYTPLASQSSDNTSFSGAPGTAPSFGSYSGPYGQPFSGNPQMLPRGYDSASGLPAPPPIGLTPLSYASHPVQPSPPPFGISSEHQKFRAGGGIHAYSSGGPIPIRPDSAAPADVAEAKRPFDPIGQATRGAHSGGLPQMRQSSATASSTSEAFYLKGTAPDELLRNGLATNVESGLAPSSQTAVEQFPATGRTPASFVIGNGVSDAGVLGSKIGVNQVTGTRPPRPPLGGGPSHDTARTTKTTGDQRSEVALDLMHGFVWHDNEFSPEEKMARMAKYASPGTVGLA